jgi:hypothetical protein
MKIIKFLDMTTYISVVDIYQDISEELHAYISRV